MPCFVNNPENADKPPAMRNYKTKELEVVNHIKKHFGDYSWNFDKTIQDGCSKRRPDIFLDCGPYVLIVLKQMKIIIHHMIVLVKINE